MSWPRAGGQAGMKVDICASGRIYRSIWNMGLSLYNKRIRINKDTYNGAARKMFHNSSYLMEGGSAHVYAWYVDPIGPYLILEKATLELGLLFSTSRGSPEEVGQAPRATPGLDGLPLTG